MAGMRRMLWRRKLSASIRCTGLLVDPLAGTGSWSEIGLFDFAYLNRPMAPHVRRPPDIPGLGDALWL
jgi:hypothetical protein